MKRHLCGTHAVRESLAARPRDVAVIYVADEASNGPFAEILATARRAGATVEHRSVQALDALARGIRHQGVIAVTAGDYPYVDLDALLDAAAAPGLVVALDEVTDPHNFGAVVRSAVALGAHGVVTLRDRAAPVTAAVVRASAGATEHCRIARVTNLSRSLEVLHGRDYRVVGLAAEGTVDLEAIDLTGPVALVVGSEGHGLRRLVREGCDVLARIPLAGPVASLNASVAAAVALYEVARQRRAAAPAPDA